MIYKNISILNTKPAYVAACQNKIDELFKSNYELYEVILTIEVFLNSFIYTTCLHEDANKYLTLYL